MSIRLALWNSYQPDQALVCQSHSSVSLFIPSVYQSLQSCELLHTGNDEGRAHS